MIQPSFCQFFKFSLNWRGEPNWLWLITSAGRLNFLVPLLYINFKNSKDQNSTSFVIYQLVLQYAAVFFSVFRNYLILETGNLISSREPIMQNGGIIWSPLLYFKNFKDTNSTSLIRLQCILPDAAVHFSVFQNLLIFKRRDVISWGEPILQKGSITWLSLLYFKLKNLKILNSTSFIRFQCVLNDPEVLLWVFQSFLKFNKGDLIAFSEAILHMSWVIWSSLLYFSFKILKDPNSTWIITF